MLDQNPNISQQKNHQHFSNHVISDSYDSYGAINYKARAQRTAQNYATYQSWSPIADFGAEKRLIQDENDDSGVCSPPLWRTSPPQNQYRNLSPSSRTQAIARGQKELMEMVSKMPEGCYELSLKDIVEHSQVNNFNHEGVKEESFSKERSSNVSSEDQIIKIKKKLSNERKMKMNRSGSVENNGGFLLKMVFPVSWNSRNKKKKSNNIKKIKKSESFAMNGDNNSERVSPRPLLIDGSGEKGEESEWWKKRIVEKEESDDQSGGFSSINSRSSKSSGCNSSRSSSRNSSGRQGRGGCWSFFMMKREQKAE
ncbi:uncharacterized protein LOC126666357 [Mercurialis annua]|uniref:uncharacterized protein LOC126666357 n=1 Tax=Mercurialis annua TaxID=3986 RepID=UPI00215E252F|nr:uncharacterized protein LOC126666357 [Mercurialis annua]